MLTGLWATPVGQTCDHAGKRENGFARRPAQVVDPMGAFSEAGATRFYVQTLDLADLAHLQLVAYEVAAQLSRS